MEFGTNGGQMTTNDLGNRPVPQPALKQFKLGRAAFLGAVGVSGAALVVGSKLGGGLPNFIPGVASVGGFTIYTVTSGYPSFDAKTYQLRIDGMVSNPMTMTINDILSAQAVTEKRFYQCVTGWTVPNATWTGIPMNRLLDLVKPHAGAGAIKLYSFDGVYTESLTLEQARHPDVLMAYKLMGKPLSTAQGAPLRLVVPGMYGYKFIKWVNRIELVPHAVDGYWEQNGYDRDAYIGLSNGLSG
jgi:DMSO/TMAO reductase YedYZ molybdopterin-dependent catalytic subunit